MIRQSGPMNLGTFMALALGHPQHGYYMKRDPFGADGDFITAPEISQMFGELLGLWAGDLWMRMGSPAFTLAEAGPGRGTLMADALRATRALDGFQEAAHIQLVETSPALQKAQARTLENLCIPHWSEHPGQLPDDRPFILIANELLDALPIRQMQFTKGAWHERVVVADGDALALALAPAPAGAVASLPTNANEGDVFEAAPARNAFMALLCGHMARVGGGALLIDYGHIYSAFGDTLQAVRAHKYVPVLDDPGDADITSHVDFEAAATIAVNAGCTIYGPVTQGVFLQRLGIQERAERLKRNATAQQVAEIDAALNRLTAPDQMGEMFKVMAVTSQGFPAPAGFDHV